MGKSSKSNRREKLSLSTFEWLTLMFVAGTVIQFFFYYFVNSLCRTQVLSAARCLVLKVNWVTIIFYRSRDVSA